MCAKLFITNAYLWHAPCRRVLVPGDALVPRALRGYLQIHASRHGFKREMQPIEGQLIAFQQKLP
jgi:hypothetical protein